MTDSARPPQLPGSLPSSVAAGVSLHRRIDGIADTHPAFRRSCSRVGPKRRRFAGVMVDMFTTISCLTIIVKWRLRCEHMIGLAPTARRKR